MSIDEGDPGFEALLEFLKRSRGFDFTGYKRPSLERRFRRRMEAIGCRELRRLPRLPRGAPRGVRAALRHAADQRHRVLPRPGQPGSTCATRSSRSCSRPSRATSRSGSGAPGCARARRPTRWRCCSPRRSARTAYRERVKIYATDVDEDALTTARLALYTDKELENVPEPCARGTSSASTSGCAFRKDLRRTVIFGRNNLVSGRADLAPGPAGVPQHAHVLQRGDAGAGSCATSTSRCATTACSCSGKSEMMISHRELFAPVDLKKRIFRKLPTATVALAGARSPG